MKKLVLAASLAAALAGTTANAQTSVVPTQALGSLGGAISAGTVVVVGIFGAFAVISASSGT